MDGGGLSPGARWAAQSREPGPSHHAPWCWDTVGTGCLSGTTRSLESDCQRGLRHSPLQDGMGGRAHMAGVGGGIHGLSTCVTHAGTVLESCHEAEGVRIGVVPS